MQEIVLLILICFFSFIAGKFTADKKEIENEIKKYSKGSAAGDAAVKAYKLRNKK